MRSTTLVTAIVAVLLTCAVAGAQQMNGMMAPTAPGSAKQMPGKPMDMPGGGMMNSVGPNMMGSSMMGSEMMGPDMMGAGPRRAMAPAMMRMMFALMDADGDGSISLQEFQAAHERIFKAMDANKDGKLSFEEMMAFMHGPRPGMQRQ